MSYGSSGSYDNAAAMAAQAPQRLWQPDPPITIDISQGSFIHWRKGAVTSISAVRNPGDGLRIGCTHVTESAWNALVDKEIDRRAASLKGEK